MSLNVGQRLGTLREEKRAILGKMTTLAEKALREGRELSAGEQREFESFKSKVEELNPRIRCNESSLDASADGREKGISFARCVRALAAAGGDIDRAADYASRTLGDNLVSKALSAGSGAGGGFTIPEDFTDEVIELLQARAAVRGLDPEFQPLPRGNAILPGMGSGPIAQYIGENQNAPKTELSFRQVRLSAKKLAALVPISNDLLRFSGGRADKAIRDSLVAAVALTEDAAFLRGTGSEYSPKGLLNQTPEANKVAQTASPDRVKVLADLGNAYLRLANANVRMLRPGWIMAPRTSQALLNMVDANGNFILKAEMMLGRLNGFPYRVTTQVPINLGGGSNESEIYLADFADVVIGEAPGIEIEVSSQAAYHDGLQLQSAFSLDQTVIRIIVQNDLGVRHPESVTVITGVTWSNPLAQPA